MNMNDIVVKNSNLVLPDITTGDFGSSEVLPNITTGGSSESLKK
jgi:hypothetical protein